MSYSLVNGNEGAELVEVHYTVTLAVAVDAVREYMVEHHLVWENKQNKGPDVPPAQGKVRRPSYHDDAPKCAILKRRKCRKAGAGGSG